MIDVHTQLHKHQVDILEKLTKDTKDQKILLKQRDKILSHNMLVRNLQHNMVILKELMI